MEEELKFSSDDDPPFALPHPRGPGGVECLVLPQKEGGGRREGLGIEKGGGRAMKYEAGRAAEGGEDDKGRWRKLPSR